MTMSEMAAALPTDPAAPTTESQPAHPGPPPNAPADDFSTALPVGVHPRDSAVTVVPGQNLDSDTPVNQDGPGPQGFRTQPPWSTENEQAVPVYQRAAHDWSANQYTLSSTRGPIQLAGRRRGRQSVIVWVPTSASLGVVVSPDEGDIEQGAGVTLSPGDSIELPTEATVYGGVIVGNSSGTAYVVELYNPPGGGLGLSSS